MRFTVPQFIEHEPKIVGPLTFKQFMFIGAAATVCFIFYFTVSFTVFIVSSVFILSVSFAFAFIKVDGRPLLTVLMNFLRFILTPKMYLWKKTKKSIKMTEQTFGKEGMPKDKISLQRGGRSKLKNIKTKIDTTQ